MVISRIFDMIQWEGCFFVDLCPCLVSHSSSVIIGVSPYSSAPFYRQNSILPEIHASPKLSAVLVQLPPTAQTLTCSSHVLQSQRRITRLLSEVIHTYRHHIYFWGVLHRVQNSTSLVFSLNVLFTALSLACMFSEENLNVVLIFVPLYVSCFFPLWLFSGFFFFFFCDFL